MHHKLTAAKLQNLKAPARGRLELWDGIARGLSLRVFASGRTTWAFRYRPKSGGKRRRVGLGDYPAVGLAEARRRATRHRAAVSDGGDPQGAFLAGREAPTLGALIDQYLSERVRPKKKPRTVELYTHYLIKKVGASLRATKACEITARDVHRLHRRLGQSGKRVTANRVVVALSGVYTFAARHGLVPDGFNPCRAIEKFTERRRERYLSTEELGRLGEALRVAEGNGLAWPNGWVSKSKHARKPENRRTDFTPHVSAAFRLLLFTGCRLREILNLRWSDVDVDRGLLLLPDSKESKEEAYKTVVLNAPALEVLSKLPKLGEFVVLGDHPRKPRADLQRPWKLLRHHARLDGVRIHDLRHTHASIGAGAGLGLPILGKLLGHKHAQTTERYAHLDADPLRRASDRIGAELAVALGEKEKSIRIMHLPLGGMR